MKYDKTPQGKNGIDSDVISTVLSLSGTDRCVGIPVSVLFAGVRMVLA